MSGGTEFQREARALGDPTRHSLFRYIAAADELVSIAELTTYVQLNHNAVRQHLTILKDAGLILEEREKRSRRGRPRLLYRLHPETAGNWGTSGAYAWLATILGEAVRLKQSPRQTGRKEGHRIAAESDGSIDPASVLEHEIEMRGFRPSRSESESESGNLVEFLLGRCPFAEVAAINPDTICQLHLGLAEGLAEGVGGLQVENLTINEPYLAGCVLRVRRTLAVGDTQAITRQ